MRDGSSHLNYALYHDRYERTADGWKFSERVYEVRYLDSTRSKARRRSASTDPSRTPPRRAKSTSCMRIPESGGKKPWLRTPKSS